jgi:hypothetical protein
LKKIICLLFVFTIAISNIAQARNDSLYSVDVYVDVTEENAALAKEKAMNQANKTAFGTVARRITTQDGVEQLKTLDDDQILNFIKEVSIKSEKASNVRYIANLKVIINDELLRQYMEEKDIPSAILTASKVSIIPTFREFKTDTPMLWEANNLWRKIWEEESSNKDDILEFVSIPANGSNYASLDAKKALKLDNIAMEQIAFNNDTKDIFVADAVYNGIEGLTISVHSYQDGTVETVEVYGERSPQLILDAISEVKKSIENRLKKQSVIESNQKNEIEALYNYESMSDWVNVERALKEVNGVEDVKMTAMSSGRVQFQISFSGNLEKLLLTLNEHFFSLKPQGEFYILEKI